MAVPVTPPLGPVSFIFMQFLLTEEVFHIISFEPISERPTSKSFHEPSVKLVKLDTIGTFWWAPHNVENLERPTV